MQITSQREKLKEKAQVDFDRREAAHQEKLKAARLRKQRKKSLAPREPVVPPRTARSSSRRSEGSGSAPPPLSPVRRSSSRHYIADIDTQVLDDSDDEVFDG